MKLLFADDDLRFLNPLLQALSHCIPERCLIKVFVLFYPVIIRSLSTNRSLQCEGRAKDKQTKSEQTRIKPKSWERDFFII
jgi:hypothetical protein